MSISTETWLRRSSNNFISAVDARNIGYCRVDSTIKLELSNCVQLSSFRKQNDERLHHLLIQQINTRAPCYLNN